MPQSTSKKTAAGKSGGSAPKKTSSSAKKPSSSGKKAQSAKASAAAQKRAAEELAQRRCVFAAVLLVLCFLGFLSLFQVGGFLVAGYRAVFYWLLGYGAEVLPLCFLVAGILLVVRRRKRVRAQVFCWLSIPLIFGALRHLLSLGTEYYPALSGPTALGQDGVALRSGGFLAGGLAELLRAALSTVGGTILLVVLLVLCLFFGCRLTGEKLVNGAKKLRPLPEPEPEPRPEPVPAPAPQPARRTAKPNIDVALDDTPVSVRTPDPHRDSRIPPPNVETPAETLRGIFHREKHPAPETPAPDTAPDALSGVAPIVQGDLTTLPMPAEEARPVAEGPVLTLSPEEPAAPAPVSAPPSAAEEAPFDLDPPADKPASSEPAEEESVSQQIEKALAASQGAPIYLYPPLRLLKPGSGKPQGSQEAIRRCAERLVDTLESFGVSATVINTTDGPAVTRYELLLQRGIKFSKVANLSDDIALALGASGIRISTIPDKNAVGIEVPNEQQEIVTARDIIGSPAFQKSQSKLSFAVGKDITGQAVIGDIGKMPHMLIAGTTGSGKSVCINSILISLLYKSTPEEVRLIMVDPKMIELGVYNGIPHLLIPVVTDPKKAAGALNWAVTEMMRRYKLFSQVGARDLKGYNAEMERTIAEGGDGEILPRIVVVIDELSDLMAVARSEVEEAIIRLAQMARAAGMHLIIATQRPSADVITGLMKTNIPSRIAFAVASAVDSRIILDQMGAEKLLGKGDMLYFPLGLQKPQRVQGCFVTDGEVEEVVNFVKQCGTAEYSQEILDHIEKQAQQAEAGASAGGGDDGEEDELFDEAVEVVVDSGMASVSMLQRRLKLGYSRAARLVDQMEERGIVGPFEGSKPRQVLVSKQEWQERMIRKREC